MSIILNCVARASLGKSASKDSRKQGVIPAVVYTKDGKNLNVLLSSPQLEKLMNDYTFMTQTFTLKVFEGMEIEKISNFKSEISEKPVSEYTVLARDIQFNVVTDKASHIDFAVVKQGEEIDVCIPVNFKNRELCNALKFGGTLNVFNYNPKVRTSVGKIPSVLDIDLTGLLSGKIIRLSDVTLPEGSRMLKDCDIAKVSGKRSADAVAGADTTKA